MTTLRTAAQEALEALEFMADEWGFTQKANRPERWQAIEALRAALEQPEQPGQEPVYWEYKHVDDGLERWNRVVPRTGQTLETAAAEIHGYRRGLKRPYEVRALYTHPPRREWRGLTEEETAQVLGFGDYTARSTEVTLTVIARAVEAALRSKNHECTT